ncbi:uncharacterized protein LOC131693328 [Topomyia yanbarensis]|uniref:uncharacterized protein LOC131693328 n=1 Tax=Topomyia yanbarensis TaxID=2498891 RepID=UPI00273C6B16|nr:uncharacterized protein LOC131693328 [Topomyia yanbarensis]
MELQNQIYLIIAVFGGVSALLLIFLVILCIYVINMKKLVVVKEHEKKYENYGFEQDVVIHNLTDDFRSTKSEAARRPLPKSNLIKPRNEDAGGQNKDTRKDKRSAGGHGRDDRKRHPSESGDTSGRDFDSAFDNEINNMFDIDDYDDQDSVVSDRNPRYNQANRHQPSLPSAINGGKRNKNFSHAGNNGHRQSSNQQHLSRPVAGRNGFQGPAHEGRTYFNEMSTRY